MNPFPSPITQPRTHLAAPLHTHLPAACHGELAPAEERLEEDGRAVLGQPDGEVEGADLEAAARARVVLLGDAARSLQLQVGVAPEHVRHEEAQLRAEKISLDQRVGFIIMY